MSDKEQNRLLTMLGVIVAIFTIGFQVLSVGEIKGRVISDIDNHERRLNLHESRLNENTKDISEIKGELRNASASKIKSSAIVDKH